MRASRLKDRWFRTRPRAGAAASGSLGTNGAGTPDALGRVAAHLAGDGEVGWEAPSRFGAAGLTARRALQRAIRPYAVRQRALDQALLDALQEARARAERLERRLDQLRGLETPIMPDPLPAGAAVDAETVIGDLWLSTADNLVTPGILEHKMYEAHLTGLLPQILRPGMTFVDVGANIGYFSVMASRLVGESGLVVAVEPAPGNVALLRANLWRNGCRNAVVLPIAAYTHTGQVQLALNPEGGAGNWVQPGELPGMTTLQVPCARLDDLLGGRRVDVLKTDAEGSDNIAIRGMEQTIRANPGIVIVAEFWTQAYGGRGESPAEVLGFYRELGLSLSLLRDTGEVEPTTPEALLALAGTVPFVNIVMRAG
jgi:FkbM family methyltransferase